MPFVTIKAPEGSFTPAEQQRMIDGVTEAMAAGDGESLRDKMRVIYEKVVAGRRPIGGTPNRTPAPTTAAG